jgi:hypothetical protein
VGSGVRHDDSSSACRRLLDRLQDEGSDFVACRLPASRQPKAGPGFGATLSEPHEHALKQRLAALLVGDIGRIDPSPHGRASNDLLVDVFEAEAISDEPTDLFTSRTLSMRMHTSLRLTAIDATTGGRWGQVT